MKALKIRAEIYSRVAGYFRPVAQWNRGKTEEFAERKVYNIYESLINRNSKVDSFKK